jgi:nucleotidyltransferase substrate binding protein (TIGR01987 family)
MSGPVLDLSALRGAIASLADALEIVGDTTWFGRQSPKVQNTLIAGVIQNFEFVHDIAVKMIRRRLELDAASPTEVDVTNFRDMLRTAGEKGLIADMEAWFDYRKMRNVTAHTYDRAKAIQVYQDTLKFVDDAKSLLVRLEARDA